VLNPFNRPSGECTFSFSSPDFERHLAPRAASSVRTCETLI
jgi:hypothetical protein